MNLQRFIFGALLFFISMCCGWAQHFSPNLALNHTIEILPDEQRICCLPGDTVLLRGHYSSKDVLLKVRLVVDHRPVYWRELATTGDDDYSLQWTAPAPGSYDVRVGYMLGSGGEAIVQRVRVDVVANAPVILANMPAQAFGQVAVLPTLDTSSQFRPARVDVDLNGETAATSSSAPFAVNVPLTKRPYGSYTVRIEAYSASGERFETTSSSLFVPPSLQITLPPEIELAQKDDMTPLEVQIHPGLVVRRIDYYVGGLLVDTEEHAPFLGHADLSSLRSDVYQCFARLTDGDGTTHDSPTYDIQFINKPQDDSDAQVLVAVAESQQIQYDQEMKRKLEASTNTRDALTRGFVSIAATPVQVSSLSVQAAMDYEPQYTIVLQIANHSPKAVGPFIPQLVFSDYSSVTLLPTQEQSPGGEMSSGELDGIIDGNGQETITYTGKEIGVYHVTRMPIRIDFGPELGNLSVPVSM